VDTSTRLPGHGLYREGWPVISPEQGRGWHPAPRRSDIGRALCECGEMSEPLLSAAERKRWHRGHKAAVRARMESSSDEEGAGHG
jgi:hypothetical protein